MCLKLPRYINAQPPEVIVPARLQYYNCHIGLAAQTRIGPCRVLMTVEASWHSKCIAMNSIDAEIWVRPTFCGTLHCHGCNLRELRQWNPGPEQGRWIYNSLQVPSLRIWSRFFHVFGRTSTLVRSAGWLSFASFKGPLAL